MKLPQAVGCNTLNLVDICDACTRDWLVWTGFRSPLHQKTHNISRFRAKRSTVTRPITIKQENWIFLSGHCARGWGYCLCNTTNTRAASYFTGLLDSFHSHQIAHNFPPKPHFTLPHSRIDLPFITACIRIPCVWSEANEDFRCHYDS
jgi:hypothetical protein